MLRSSSVSLKSHSNKWARERERERVRVSEGGGWGWGDLKRILKKGQVKFNGVKPGSDILTRAHR